MTSKRETVDGTVFVVRKDELVCVNISQPDEYDEDDHGGEMWANEVLTRARFEDPADDVTEARWALNKCGFELCGDEKENLQ